MGNQMVIGLTGGIASGKSTVAKMFEAYNIVVLYADEMAKDTLQKGSDVYHKVAKAFKDTLNKKGDIDKSALARQIFDDENKRAQLNAIVHPAVKTIIEREIKALFARGETIVVIEVPLLFESGFDQLCDHTVVVYADEKTRLSRLIARDHIDATYAKKKMAAQMPLQEKVKRADTVIDNSETKEKTQQAFERFMKNLLNNTL